MHTHTHISILVTAILATAILAAAILATAILATAILPAATLTRRTMPTTNPSRRCGTTRTTALTTPLSSRRTRSCLGGCTTRHAAAFPPLGTRPCSHLYVPWRGRNQLSACKPSMLGARDGRCPRCDACRAAARLLPPPSAGMCTAYACVCAPYAPCPCPCPCAMCIWVCICIGTASALHRHCICTAPALHLRLQVAVLRRPLPQVPLPWKLSSHSADGAGGDGAGSSTSHAAASGTVSAGWGLVALLLGLCTFEIGLKFGLVALGYQAS